MNTVRRRWWPWILGAAVLFFVVLAVAGTAWLALATDPVRQGMNLTIDGETIRLDGGHGTLALAGLGVALLAVLVVVPVCVALALALGLMGAAVGIGVALLAVLVVAAVATAPLWLLVLGLWLVLRRKPAAKTAAA